jgi:hypothetical protein
MNYLWFFQIFCFNLVRFFLCSNPTQAGSMTLSITRFNIKTLSIMGLYVTLSKVTLSITMIYHYVECRISFIIMQRVIMLSVIIVNVVMLNEIVLSVITLSVIMLSVIMLSVIMLSVIMLNVIMQSVITLSVVMLSASMLNVFMLSVFMLTVVMLSLTYSFCLRSCKSCNNYCK